MSFCCYKQRKWERYGDRCTCRQNTLHSGSGRNITFEVLKKGDWWVKSHPKERRLKFDERPRIHGERKKPKSKRLKPIKKKTSSYSFTLFNQWKKNAVCVHVKDKQNLVQ